MKLTDQDIFKKSDQLMVVTAENWHSTTGRLRIFEKENGRWNAGIAFDVTLGKNGMIWGDGLILFEDPISKKVEGDNKTPVGAYAIEAVYGYAAAADVDFVKLPYLQVHKNLKCVDDPESEYYNQLVDEREVEKDWNSAEDMLRDDHLYKWGIIIDYNRSHIKKGKGSCIFMHLWRTPETPTAGCTAMTEENMLKLIQWLDPQKNPVLVQFPQKEYKSMCKKFNLPFI